ncbi:universal stress family protein [Bacteroides sp. CAG:633]|mgnify:FL=1|jgi:nucleotide-binding universal stress UspA family protein|uniref:universal stress protein n=1 Tax=Bacteroides sp. CAG:633 TaxID=1262744 RepID=UPI0003387EDD|nr:universal stress protein [Bacteroides sp. CAG:633]CDB09868.1 universal stress family protein [Bacteroides sp. CAG:633]
MEDKLVTLAILTYAKAQILKTILEDEGIETYIHNVNQIQPVISSGVRVRIKESDLPHALKIIESSAWLSEDVVGGKVSQTKSTSNKVLIPVDFSGYSMKACEFGFNYAQNTGAEVILLHVYFTPIYSTSLPYGDIFNYQLSDDENVKTILQKVHAELNGLLDKVKEKIASGQFPNVKYMCVLREGIPEEEILRYVKDCCPRIVIMGTRGKNQKDLDLIGSVTAEVIERSRVPVLAIPENTPFRQFSEVKHIAFITNFDQRDLIAFDSLIASFKSFRFSVSLIHLSGIKDTWDEIKLGGIKEYFHKQYPQLDIHYDVVQDDDLLNNLEQYIEKENIDIIALTSYRRNIFYRLFNPSIARKMIFHSDTPMLVLTNRS